MLRRCLGQTDPTPYSLLPALLPVSINSATAALLCAVTARGARSFHALVGLSMHHDWALSSAHEW